MILTAFLLKEGGALHLPNWRQQLHSFERKATPTEAGPLLPDHGQQSAGLVCAMR
jgi:hypothetical protein